MDSSDTVKELVEEFVVSALLRFNVLFYIVYWKYHWIFGSLTKSIGYLISARFHGCEVSHVAILVGRSCG